MIENKLFPIKFFEKNGGYVFVGIEDKSKIWHMRLGHLNFQSLKALLEVVRGLPKLEECKDVCEGCALGKQARDKFPKDEAWRAKHPLQLVHTDIYGPMQIESFGKSTYFITFIDDFTRMCWVYFISSKDEAFKCFKGFKLLVEKQSEHSVKCLRSDKGGEYCRNEFF